MSMTAIYSSSSRSSAVPDELIRKSIDALQKAARRHLPTVVLEHTEFIATALLDGRLRGRRIMRQRSDSPRNPAPPSLIADAAQNQDAHRPANASPGQTSKIGTRGYYIMPTSSR